MRLPPLVLAAALLAGPLFLVAVAPGAAATDPCTTLEPSCPGFVCAHHDESQSRDACVGERFHCFDGPCSLPIDP